MQLVRYGTGLPNPRIILFLIGCYRETVMSHNTCFTLKQLQIDVFFSRIPDIRKKKEGLQRVTTTLLIKDQRKD